jgi:hypothetical protein
VILGVLPILQAFEPEWAEELDPATSLIVLAQNGRSTTPAVVLPRWGGVPRRRVGC